MMLILPKYINDKASYHIKQNIVTMADTSNNENTINTNTNTMVMDIDSDTENMMGHQNKEDNKPITKPAPKSKEIKQKTKQTES